MIFRCYAFYAKFGHKLNKGLVVLLLILLSACKIELYTNLSEQDANAMLAILMQHGISSEKSIDKDGAVLWIEQSQFADAIDLLKAHGYPRDQFASIGSVFPQEGLISSPLEERIRYIYALSQDVAETLSQIEGVMTARVHVVLPDQRPFETTVAPSSAAVFIKYRENSNLENFVPRIKSIVNNSIEGLTYDNISVALFPSSTDTLDMSTPTLTRVGGGILQVSATDVTRFWILVGVLLMLLLAALVGNGVLFWRMRKDARQRAKNS
jgi:type III secretion protein J